MGDDIAGLTREHLRESSLIEGIDDPVADIAMAGAWQWLAPFSRLTRTRILTTHRLITARQLGKEAGRTRRVNVRVGVRICPQWPAVPPLLADWLRKMQHPAQYAPKDMHVEFELIHPFIDGNGRVGRLLLWWHQIKVGEQPILLRAAERHTYYQWFQ
jgi:Fic family protein